MGRLTLALMGLAGGCCWDEATRVWAFGEQVHWSADTDSGAQDAAVDGLGGLWLARTKLGGEYWNLLETEDRSLELTRVGDEVGAVGWKSDGDLLVSLPAKRPGEPLSAFEAPISLVRAAGLDDALIVSVHDATGPRLLWYQAGWSPIDIPVPDTLRLGLLAARGQTIAAVEGQLLLVGGIDGEWTSILLDTQPVDIDVSADGDVWLLFGGGSSWVVEWLDHCKTSDLPFERRPALRAEDAGMTAFGFDESGALQAVEVDLACETTASEVAPAARKADLVAVDARSGLSPRLIGTWTFPTNRERFGDVEDVECE